MGFIFSKPAEEPAAPGTVMLTEDTTKVNLSSRSLTEFPEAVTGLKHLVTLNVGYNKITKIPASIGQLSNTLTSLTLAGNQLRELPEEIGALASLTDLIISKNALVALPESIGDLKSLRSLNAMLNRIERLPKRIGECQSLEKLKLSVNQLSELPESLGQLSLLSELDVSSCHLSSLPDIFDSLTSLDNLNIRNNLVAELPKSICLLPSLRVLDARNNEIGKLPKRIGSLPKLRVLHVSQNLLETLPSSIGACQNLATLSVDQNQLIQLPKYLFSIKTLQTLDAHRNSIQELPDDSSFSELDKLQSLDLRQNALRKLPSSIGSLKALKKLYLSDNELTELPSAIGKLESLLELEVSNNQLKSIPSSMGNCSRLSMLELTRNRIKSVPATLGKIGALMQLKLGSNRISSLDEALFDGLSELLNLNVFDNQLSHVPASIAKCQKLQRLDVSYNKLRALPSEVRTLRALNHIGFSGNAFTIFPKDICALPLKEVFASCNRFTELPREISKLAATLQVLDLAANQLGSLPEELCDLAALKELELGHNRVKVLPPRMVELQALVNLDLSNNVGLYVTRELIEAWVAIEQLKLGFCEMTEFPSGTQLPKSLGLIQLEGNLLDWSSLDDKVRSLSEMSAHTAREKRRFEFSWSEMRGARPSQEDTIVIHTNRIESVNWRSIKQKHGSSKLKRDLCVVSVFDGHRGSSAAEFAAHHLIEVLYKHCAVDPVEVALNSTFNEISSRIIKSRDVSGATALVVTFFGDELYVANCGDARAVLCRGGNAVRLSVDHKPDDPLERKRIRELGGFVSHVGRILDDIMVARSLGDAQNQPYVTCEPYVAHFEMTPDDEFLILGCDGIWDVITDEQAVDLVREFATKESLQAPAVALRDYAYSAGSTDNLSCIIVYLNRLGGEGDDGKDGGRSGDKKHGKDKKSRRK
eukprot:CAMPEP_0170752724 /NCGR_PEP_ID=MMETSP0437-20130122/12116_1 /TAXON_ID=0 /ORGANISM="Sexangularia sp." /LENGTH=929 /DNA_ID=CAMNT_0011091803 /DNA_START=26 /DNA_END=2815 /DNA_ORIENTATION=-